MIKGAIFDVDGTLLDTMPVWREAASKYLSKLGITVDPQLGAKFFEMTLPESAREIRRLANLELSVEALVEGISQSVVAEYRDSAQAKPGAIDFLEALHQANIPLTVVSSGTESLIRAAFSRLGIEDYFTGIFASTEQGLSKREPTMFLQAQELMGTSTQDTWVFEDALYAIKVVKPLGFRTIAVADEASRDNEAQLRAEAEDFWESFPPEIPPLLRSEENR